MSAKYTSFSFTLSNYYWNNSNFVQTLSWHNFMYKNRASAKVLCIFWIEIYSTFVNYYCNKTISDLHFLLPRGAV